MPSSAMSSASRAGPGLARAMPGLRERHGFDLAIVNGENSAGGLGITEGTANDLFGMGFDAITLGNHAYRRKEVFELPRPTPIT